jgi:hypothetical protein
MGMSGALLRPKTSGHPEALAWRSAVIANGGTVSASTMTAVTTFCRSIDAAGLRDRFYRLNLFCGTGLEAVLVPLYRGPSRTGTQYGNTTDTNGNFVLADYVETGSSGGLTGNGSNRHLATGLVPFNAGMTEQNYHNSGYFNATLNTNGEFISAAGTRTAAFFPAFSTNGMFARFGGAANSGLENATLAARNGHLIGSRSGGAGVGYRNGVNLASGANTSSSQPFATDQPPGLFVFARNAAGTPSTYFTGRACMYSVGIQFTDAQALAFYNAVQAFQASLGRQI